MQVGRLPDYSEPADEIFGVWYPRVDDRMKLLDDESAKHAVQGETWSLGLRWGRWHRQSVRDEPLDFTSEDCA